MLRLLKKHLPWRFQNKVNFLNAHSNFIFKAILDTPPIPCNINAEVSYISLLCHRDVNIGLMAMKSFLRFCNNVRIIVQDDGSLSEQDKIRLAKHIPGMLFIDRTEADQRLSGKISNRLHEARQKDPSFLKLVDVNLLFQGPKIVADSDILFLKRPNEIIDWINISENNRKPFFHEVNDANKVFEKNLDRINQMLHTRIEKLDYCSGFIGLDQSIIPQDIENIFSILSEFSQVWGLEQNIYAFLLKERSFKLPPDRYLAILEEDQRNIVNNANMIHFVGKLKHKNYYRKGRAVIASLR
ncbi:MAG TPA: hypothetical protein DCZ48_06990 [Methylococcaceae bacterium]|nr:hypothetical protein [Methylococcaceae bacterium]